MRNNIRANQFHVPNIREKKQKKNVITPHWSVLLYLYKHAAQSSFFFGYPLGNVYLVIYISRNETVKKYKYIKCFVTLNIMFYNLLSTALSLYIFWRTNIFRVIERFFFFFHFIKHEQINLLLYVYG